MKKALRAALAASALAAALVVAIVSWRLARDPGSGTGPGTGFDVAPSSRESLPRDSEVPGGAGPSPEATKPEATARGDASEPSSTENILPPAPVARGTANLVFAVFDRSGRPVSAEIAILSGLQRSSVRTGPSGIARFEGIAAGVYNYELKAEGVPPLVSGKEVVLEERQTKKIELIVEAFDLVLSGRVMDRSGNPVPGVVVSARPQLSDAREDTLVRADLRSLRAVTDRDGAYAIEGLAEAEYVVTAEGPRPVSRVYRAGLRTADLVLETVREVTVYGTVRSPSGEAIEGVEVVPVGQLHRQTRTDSSGSYSLSLAVSSDQDVYVLTASRDGFRTARVNLLRSEMADASEWEVAITLEPLGSRAPVWGTLVDSEGNPVPGEVVYLHSPGLNARYQATSGADGSFEFGEVQVGIDYRAFVYPRSRPAGAWFKDYAMTPVAVGEDGLELEIVLERVPNCSFEGTMVNGDGTPVPRYSLWLRSRHCLGHSVQLRGDSEGKFHVAEVPCGAAILETRSEPYFSVRGLELAEGAPNSVSVVLDWGDLEVSGMVVDEGGAPVAGAKVSLRWSHSEDSLESSSSRNAVTDSAGRFSFSEVGPGTHRIAVSKEGYLQEEMACEANRGEPIAVRLRPSRRGPSQPQD